MISLVIQKFDSFFVFLFRHFFCQLQHNFFFFILMHVSVFLNTVTDIKETATAINFTLMKLLSLQGDKTEGTEPSRPDSGKLK